MLLGELEGLVRLYRWLVERGKELGTLKGRISLDIRV